MVQTTAEGYRHRAEELRTIAEGVHDQTARRTLILVAKQYDQMAWRVESRDRLKTD